MESLRQLYRIGQGPSSSHTMGPRCAASHFLHLHPDAASYQVDLFGSLAATGKGHLTDAAIRDVLKEKKINISWYPDVVKPLHPNALTMHAFDAGGKEIASQTYYSIGGGKIVIEGQKDEEKEEVYPLALSHMKQILALCDDEGIQIWEFALRYEPKEILSYMAQVWNVMKSAISRGLEGEGVLPGGLKLPRKAMQYHEKANEHKGSIGTTAEILSYALAVSEENASGGEIVTAPTCGSCGVLPAVLYYLHQQNHLSDIRIERALLVAGVFGNVVKSNGSISGAEVGCQGEVGVACAMAAAAATYLLGGTIYQIEYAAEMSLEHHLGLTCDPMMGLVQIPCIERNAMAAVRAIDNSVFALLSDGRHRVSFDNIIDVMMETGQALPSLYRETSRGGLAKVLPSLSR